MTDPYASIPGGYQDPRDPGNTGVPGGQRAPHPGFQAGAAPAPHEAGAAPSTQGVDPAGNVVVHPNQAGPSGQFHPEAREAAYAAPNQDMNQHTNQMPSHGDPAHQVAAASGQPGYSAPAQPQVHAQTHPAPAAPVAPLAPAGPGRRGGLNKGNLLVWGGGALMLVIVGYGVINTLAPNLLHPRPQTSSRFLMTPGQRRPEALADRAPPASRQPAQSTQREVQRAPRNTRNSFSVDNILGANSNTASHSTLEPKGAASPPARAEQMSARRTPGANAEAGLASIYGTSASPAQQSKQASVPSPTMSKPGPSSEGAGQHVAASNLEMDALVQEIEVMRREQKTVVVALQSVISDIHTLSAQVAALGQSPHSQSNKSSAVVKQEKTSKKQPAGKPSAPAPVITQKKKVQPKAPSKAKHASTDHRPVYQLAGAANGVAWLRNEHTGKLIEVHDGGSVPGYGTILGIYSDGTIETVSGYLKLR